jgi:hypothetical protein
VLPIASVAAFALIYGNYFNGAVFVLLAVTLGALAARAPRARIPAPDGWTAGLGAAMFTFAWLYPHFLVGVSPAVYAFGAPMGLLPCPTLSLVIGLALLTGGPGGRAFTFVTAAAGLFYALFGALRLGVWLDVGLLIGAVGLLARSFTWEGHRPHLRHA